MSENKKHTNEIAIKILNDEYADYDNNWWHYNREYKMLVNAQTEAWKQANEAAEQQEKALNLACVVRSLRLDKPSNGGWLFDSDFLRKTTKAANKHDPLITMEDVEYVLRALTEKQ